MKLKIIMKLVTVVLMAVLLGSCQPTETNVPEETRIVDTDVLGQWELDYDGKTIFDEETRKWISASGAGTLIFDSNYSYVEKIRDSEGQDYVYKGANKKWSIVLAPGTLISSVVLSGYRGYFHKKNIAGAEIELRYMKSKNIPIFGNDFSNLCFRDPDNTLCFKRKAKGS